LKQARPNGDKILSHSQSTYYFGPHSSQLLGIIEFSLSNIDRSSSIGQKGCEKGPETDFGSIQERRAQKSNPGLRHVDWTLDEAD
jgi:hypothetical protein